MIAKDLEKNLNLSLKLHSEMGKPLNYSLRRGAVSIDTLDKLWARRTSVSGKAMPGVRFKSARPLIGGAVGSIRSFRSTGI